MRHQERTIEEIEAEMARSRTEIERTSQALKQSINPDHLSEAARQVLLEGTVRVEDKVKDLADAAGDQVESLGALAVEAIRKNPLPALIASMGLGLLISLAERDSRRDLTSSPLSSPGQGATSTQNVRPTSVPSRTLREARRANLRHPVLVGAAIFGVGLLLGALLPATEREDDLMGPYRDRLLADGKESAQHVLNQAKSAIHLGVDRSRAEVSEIKDDMEAVAMQAFHQARHDGSDRHEPEPI